MSAADQAYRTIRHAILAGTFAQAERLPEEMLVEMCGVSRTPVREALRRLVVEGFVENEPRQSARVASWSWEEIEEVFDLRSVLESHGARLAATRISEAQLNDLRRYASDMEEAYFGRGETFQFGFAEANAAFHGIVIEAANQPRLAQIVAQLALPPMVFRTLDLYDNQAIQRSLAQHRELIAALEARDERWAAAVMQAHLSAARVTISNQVGKGSFRVRPATTERTTVITAPSRE